MTVNRLLERLGGVAVRWRWVVIVGWLIILGGLLGARHEFGGTYVNDYTVPGTDSAKGLNRLNNTFPQEGGFGGQIVFHAPHGTVQASSSAVNQATSNVAKLPHVISAVSPFSSSNSGTVSKNGSIAYASVTWKVNPYSLDTSYLNRLNKAVAPARKAGLVVDYGAGAGNIGQQVRDTTSEVIGLACALALLLFSVGAGLAILGLLAAATTSPTTAPTIATLLGLGVAVDYGLFLVARHRE